MSHPHPSHLGVPNRHRPLGRLPLLPRQRLLVVLLLPLLTTRALAGSATAESIWDRNDARQRALQQMPRGATVTDTQCEEISVANGNDRYRCTVFYVDPPAQAPPSAAQPDPAHPRP